MPRNYYKQPSNWARESRSELLFEEQEKDPVASVEEVVAREE